MGAGLAYMAFIGVSGYVGSLLAHGIRRVVVSKYRKLYSDETILSSRTWLERSIMIGLIFLAWFGLLDYLQRLVG